MKKIVVNMVLILLLVMSGGISNAQTLKGLVNKAKDKVKNAGNKEVPVNNSSNISSGNSSGNNSQNISSSSTSTENIVAGGIEEFLQEKYILINSNDDDMDIYSLDRGTISPETHLGGAKKLDYAATVAKLKSEGKLLVTDRKYTEVMNYGKKYEEVFQGTLKGIVNNKIEEAYQKKKYNEKEAIEMAKDAFNLAEAASLILYENQEAQQLKADAEKTLNDLGGNYFKNLYTSDFHKKNAGKILFSKTPIVIGKEDPNQFVTTITGTDKLYAVAYLNAKIKDLGQSSTYDLEIDGNNAYLTPFSHNQADLELSYYLIEIIPDPKVALHSYDPLAFGPVLGDLSPRKHTMNLGFVFGYGEKAAIGTLSLDWSNADGAAIKANNELAAKNAQDNWARNLTLPEHFSKPSKSFGDPELSVEKIKAAIMANSEYSQNIKQITKIVIGEKYNESDGDWILFKNDVGIPTHKASNRGIFIIFTGKDGWCYYSKDISFKRSYEGAGTYSKAKLFDADSDQYTKIGCEKAK
jgi:hypothetical protein